MKTKKYLVFDPIYMFNCSLYIGKRKAVKKAIQKDFPTAEVRLNNTALAETIPVPGWGYVLYILPTEDSSIFWSTLVHELGHVTLTVMDNVGISVNEQESYCYHLAGLFSMFYDKINKSSK